MAEPHAVAGKIIEDAKRLVRGPDGRLRIEEYLSALAAVAGEMVLRRSQVINLDSGTVNPGFSVYVSDAKVPPGSAVLSPHINALLSGDRSSWAEIPVTSTFGALYNVLTRSQEVAWPADSFPDVAEVYQFFAAARKNGVSQQAWGWAPLSIPVHHHPKLQPLRAAYNLRQTVLSQNPAKADRLEFDTTVTAIAVLLALSEVRGAIDLRVALSLVFETINAMAKTVPMLPRHMASVAHEKRLPEPQPDRRM
jgi:hypothetical protein